MHLQMSEQKMAAWKHSQYFFRHPLFLQLQPLVWRGGAEPSASRARAAAASDSLPCGEVAGAIRSSQQGAGSGGRFGLAPLSAERAWEL